MPKMMSPNTRIDWFPENAFANPEEPTIAELNAGTNISCAIVAGYTLGFTDSDTNDERSICDEGNVQTRGFANFEASLSFFRAPLDASDPDSLVYDAARDIFKGELHVTGYLVSRQGYKSNVAYAEGQHISLYKVTSDLYRDISGDPGSSIQFEVPFMQQGTALANYEIPAPVGP
jgi:hypothetical protein